MGRVLRRDRHRGIVPHGEHTVVHGVCGGECLIYRVYPVRRTVRGFGEVVQAGFARFGELADLHAYGPAVPVAGDEEVPVLVPDVLYLAAEQWRVRIVPQHVEAAAHVETVAAAHHEGVPAVLRVECARLADVVTVEIVGQMVERFPEIEIADAGWFLAVFLDVPDGCFRHDGPLSYEWAGGAVALPAIVRVPPSCPHGRGRHCRGFVRAGWRSRGFPLPHG